MKKLVMVLAVGFALMMGLGACAAPSEETPQQQAAPIDWDALQDSDVLPTPPSKVGTVEWNRTYGFTVDVTHVDKGAFDQYVQACRNEGFILNFATRDDYYSAFNKDGFKLTLELRDGSILYINLMRPTDKESNTEDQDKSTDQETSETSSTQATPQSTQTPSNDAKKEQTSQPVNPAEDTIVIKDSAYVISNGFVEYVVELHNNRQDYKALFATITATGRNAEGTVTFNSKYMVSGILPNSTTYWASQAGNGSCSESDTVEFSVSVNSQDWVKSNTTLPKDLYTFNDVNVSDSPFSSSATATGEITLTQSFSADDFQNANSPMIVCVLKDDKGKLVAGYSQPLMSELQVRQTQAFEIYLPFSLPNYASVEMYAYPWL